MRSKKSGKDPTGSLAGKFQALPLWARSAIFLTAGLITVMFVAFGLLASNYSSKAAALDITALERIQTGTEVLDKDGSEIGRIMIEDRKVLQYHEIPKNVINAVVATEDNRFFTHHGVDLRGMARSAIVNLKAMGIEQGASTITQQLTRHVYRLRGRSFDRKLTEIFAARRLEKEYSKNEILTYYLNNIYLGSGFYGVGSASEGYFGKEVGELEIHEAAVLAGIIKSPTSYSPFTSPEKALAVRNLSLGRMKELGMITKSEYEASVGKPLEILDEHERDSRPFFALQAVRREVELKTDSRDDIDEGRVFTTLDNSLIDASIAAIQTRLHKYETRVPGIRQGDRTGDSSLEAAAVVIDNRTGRILSAVGGRNYRENSFDYAFKGRRTPGTALLPVTYAAYFSGDNLRMRGYVMDAPIDNAKVMIGGTKGMLGEWGTLVDEFEGEIPAAHALFQSKTGASVRAGNEVGVGDFIETARKFGITSPIREYPASFVGASDLTLIELARAYTVFANGGMLSPEPFLVDGVFGRHGEKISLKNRAPAYSMRAVTREVADFTRAILVSRMHSPVMDSILHEFGLGDRGLAGQHGSSHGGRDAWFVGFDKNITCAVWIGRLDDSAMDIENPGYNLAMPVWAEIMAAATAGRPAGFEIARGTGRSICLKSGDLATPLCARGKDFGLIPADSVPQAIRPTSECTLHAEGGKAPPKAKAVVATESPSGYSATFIEPAEKFLADGDPYSGKGG